MLRDLDCAVIHQLHEYNIGKDGQIYDSVRGVFIEGKEVYPGAEIREKTHIQLCIVNPNCIKGLFGPREMAEDIGCLDGTYIQNNHVVNTKSNSFAYINCKTV